MVRVVPRERVWILLPVLLLLGSALEAAPPVVKGVYLLEKRSTSATLGWDTNMPASSVLVLRRSNGIEVSARTGQQIPVLYHEATLSGLVPNTTYHYRVHATAPDGSGTVTSWKRFVTLRDPNAPATPSASTAGTSLVLGAARDPQVVRARKLLEDAAAKIGSVEIRQVGIDAEGLIHAQAVSFPAGPHRLRMPGITDLYDALLSRPRVFQEVRLRRIQKTQEKRIEVSSFAMSLRLVP